MNRKKYKDALAKLEQARSLNVQEKDEEITSMIAEIEKLKEDNPFKRLLNALKNGADETFLCKRQISFFQSQFNKLRINIIKSTIIIFFLKEITTS